MASSLIGQLRVLLGLETAQLETGAKKAKTELRGIGDAAKEVRGLISTMFAAFAISALDAVVKTSLEHVEALAKQAKALGTTTQALQEMRYAAGQAGVSTEIFDKAMFKLSKSLGDARNGAEAPKKAFAELSKIIGHDITAGTGDALKILPEFSDALTKIEDPTRRNSIEAHLLGKAYGDMAPFLALGAEKINALSKSANDLGIVLSNEQIQGAEETAHKLKSLHDILGARIDGAVASNAKAILGFADAITHVALALAKFWGQNPKLAMGLVGAAAGASLGRVGGIYGVAAGGVGGFLLGEHIAGDTPESLRSQAYKYRTTAQMQGRALGYYSASPAKQKAILSAPGVGSNLQKYHQLLAQADALERSQALAAPPETGGDATPGQFLAGKGHHGHDRSNEIAKDNENKQFEIDKATLDEKQQLLQAQQALTIDTEDRNNLAIEILDVEHDQKALEIRHKLNQTLLDKNATEATKDAARQQAARATVLNDQLVLLKRQGTMLQAELAREQQAAQTDALSFQLKQERLKLEEELAQTAAERRTVELQILDLTYQQKREALQHVINDQYLGQYTHNADDRTRAQLELDALAGNYALDHQKVLLGTEGPLEQLQRSIPDTAAKMNEALQQVASQGLASMVDGLSQASASWIKMGGTAGNILRQIYSDIMKLLMERYLEKPALGLLGKLFDVGTAFAGGGGGLDFGSASDIGISGSEIPIPNLPGFATGGSLMIGGMAGVDQNLLSINGSPVARVGQGERLDVVPANDQGVGGGGAWRLIVEPSELFNTHLVAATDAAAVRGAAGGAMLGRLQLMQAADRRLGR